MKLAYVMLLALVAMVAADSFEHQSQDESDYYNGEEPSNYYSHGPSNIYSRRQSRSRRREGFVGSVSY